MPASLAPVRSSPVDSGRQSGQGFPKGADFKVSLMNPLNPKRLLVPAVVAAAAATILTAPLAHAGGGGGGGVVAPAAQVGTDLAVPLSPTTASPGTQGLFQYINIPGSLSLRVELKGATVAGAPASGPVQMQLTTKSLDCATSTNAVITGM